MGMDAATRLKLVVSELSKFYERRFQETALVNAQSLGIDFEADNMDERAVDTAYGHHITELSTGLDVLLGKLGVRLDPAPPGSTSTSSCETLAGGVRFLGWHINVFDASTNMPVGIIHWGMYHRHDSFCVPGPAQVAFVKAAPSRTIIVG